MTARRNADGLSERERFAAYSDTNWCEGIWSSALEQHMAQQTAARQNSREILVSGFGSAAAAGGSVLYDTADLICRIDRGHLFSRKETDGFRREAASLTAKAEMFQEVSSPAERKQIMEAWQIEQPGGSMPELDSMFCVAVTSLLDSAICDAYSRRKRNLWSKTLEHAAARLEHKRNETG